jgi:hypothetical protein
MLSKAPFGAGFRSQKKRSPYFAGRRVPNGLTTRCHCAVKMTSKSVAELPPFGGEALRGGIVVLVVFRELVAHGAYNVLP